MIRRIFRLMGLLGPDPVSEKRRLEALEILAKAQIELVMSRRLRLRETEKR